jgi:predicted transcriptional regulator
MRLSKTAILALRGTDQETKERIAKAIGVSTPTIYRYIQANEINGQLTKAAAVKKISEETGLSNDQVLEEDTVKESEG